MSDNVQLEAYLSALDKALGQIPIGDRSEIITEIKSHILDAKDRNPEQSLSSIISSMGEPESVANRYLLERGLKPNRPSKRPIIKWLVIGFLGTFAIACFSLILIIWHFTPLVSIDEENDRVVLLGGAIDLNGATEMVKIGNITINGNQYLREIEGKYAFTENELQEINVDFKNGKFEVSTVKDNTLTWQCKLTGSAEPEIGKNRYSYDFDFYPSDAVKCKLMVPESLKQNFKGLNGKLEFVKPRNDLTANVTNGKIVIEPSKDLKYIYDLSVTNGKVSGLVSDGTSKEDIHISINVTNGKISKK